jgi:hypothetical protein
MVMILTMISRLTATVSSVITIKFFFNPTTYFTYSRFNSLETNCRENTKEGGNVDKQTAVGGDKTITVSRVKERRNVRR